MDLLYMPLLELQQHLKQELLGNPFLELVEPEEETEVPLSEDGKEAEKEKAGDDEPNWEDILLDDGTDQGVPPRDMRDRKSTRLNSSHGYISYAVFCLKKKKKNQQRKAAK